MMYERPYTPKPVSVKAALMMAKPGSIWNGCGERGVRAPRV